LIPQKRDDYAQYNKPKYGKKGETEIHRTLQLNEKEGIMENLSLIYENPRGAWGIFTIVGKRGDRARKEGVGGP